MVTSKRRNTIITIVIIAVIVIVFVGGYYLKDYQDKQKRISEINDYKKGFYNGLLCEYSCPLSMQNMSNTTQMLPTLDCVKGCTGPFKAKYASFSYTQKELEMDNLLRDINSTISYCKIHSVNMTAMKLDTVAYFNCAAKGVEGLKQNYTYLNN